MFAIFAKIFFIRQETFVITGVLQKVLEYSCVLLPTLALVYFVRDLGKTRQDKTRQDTFIRIRLHRVQYGENINKIDSQSVKVK